MATSSVEERKWAVDAEKEQRSSLAESSDSKSPAGSSEARELASRLQNPTSRTITPEPPPPQSRIVSASDVLLHQAIRVKELQQKVVEEINALRGMLLIRYPGKEIQIGVDELIMELQAERAANKEGNPIGN